MTVKTEAYQLGLSGTASQNFHLTAALADGTMQLYRGNPGAPIGAALLNIDATGSVSLPGEPAWTTVAIAPVADSGALTSANGTFSYRRMGKTCFFRLVINIVTNGTGNGYIKFTLPFNAAAGAGEHNFIGRVAANAMVGFIVPGAPSILGMTTYSGTYPGSNGAVLNMSGTFETV